MCLRPSAEKFITQISGVHHVPPCGSPRRADNTCPCALILCNHCNETANPRLLQSTGNPYLHFCDSSCAWDLVSAEAFTHNSRPTCSSILLRSSFSLCLLAASSLIPHIPRSLSIVLSPSFHQRVPGRPPARQENISSHSCVSRSVPSNFGKPFSM